MTAKTFAASAAWPDAGSRRSVQNFSTKAGGIEGGLRDGLLPGLVSDSMWKGGNARQRPANKSQADDPWGETFHELGHFFP